MNDREVAKQIVADVFNIDIKGEIGRMARHAVSKEDKRDIVNRVHRLITALREEMLTQSPVSHATYDAHERSQFLPCKQTMDMDTQ
jgi:hypothetical protein